MTNRRRIILALALVAGVTGCDQSTKYQALASLTDTFQAVSGFGEKVERFLAYQHPTTTRVVEVVPGIWHHRYVENTGSAFSLWRGASSGLGRFALLLIRAAIAVFLLIYLVKTRDLLVTLGVAAVLGGAIGNLLDGARFGYVIDFIHWHWQDAFNWPVFNIADAAISIGIGLLLIASFKRKGRVLAGDEPEPHRG